MQNLFLLMRRQEALKDVTRLLYNPHLTGNRIRTSGIYNYAVKGYSANSVMRELGDELIVGGNFEGGLVGTMGNANETATYTINDISPISGTKDAILAVTVAGTNEFRPQITYGNVREIGKTYKLSFRYKVNSGTVNFKGYYKGSTNVLFTLPLSGSGVYEVVYVCDGIAAINIYFDGRNLLNLQLDDISNREVLATDLNQSTAANQPQLDRVALIEPLGLKNQNGGVGFMTHSPISFAANEAWTVECVVNWNGSNAVNCGLFGTGNSLVSVKNVNNLFRFRNETGTSDVNTTKQNSFLIGKAKFLTFKALGNNTIAIYIDGVLWETVSFVTNFMFTNLFNARASYSEGSVFHYAIYSKALSDTEILEGASILRSIFPEIPSVRVAGLDVAVRNLDVVTSANGTTIPDGTVTGTWVGGTAFWCHHTNIETGSVYGKLYNKAGRDVIVANPPSGYRVSTEADLTALSLLDPLTIKAQMSSFWITANGTNTTGLSLIGSGKRNADGSFSAIKGDCYIWCADSDKVLHITDAGVATIEAITDVKDGYSIRLVKV
jgi:hypothetical protein